MIQYFPIVTGSLTVLGNINVSGSITTSGSITISGSITSASFADSASNATNAISASYANNLTVAGTLTAQTIVVQTVTSSVIYSSGSNVFGNNIANTQVFTGSVTVTGSLAVVTNGTEFQVTSTGVNLGNALTDSHVISGSLRVNPNGLFVSSSGIVGIGNINPSYSLDVSGTIRGTGTAFDFYTSSGLGTSSASGLMRVITAGTSVGIAIGQSNSTRYTAIAANDYNIYNDDFFMRTNGAFPLVLGTNNTARLTITSTGNVGIGTSTVNASSGYTMLRINGGSGSEFSLAQGGTDYAYMYANSSLFAIATQAAIPMVFQTNATERMRITSTGACNHTVNSDSVFNIINLYNSSAVNSGNRINFQNYFGDLGGIVVSQRDNGSLADDGQMLFQVASNAALDTKMTILNNGSIGAPSGTNIYNASDIRLKKNITTVTNGLDKISALNPVKFNWVDGFEPSEDGKDMLGFIAQEVQNIIPEAVEKFGNNSVTLGETTIENPLRVNEKFIIPVLTKALQELNTKFEEYKATHP